MSEAKKITVKEVMTLPDEVIQLDRKGYEIHFMKADDEKKINDLTSTGKVIGQVVYDSNKPGEQGNEIAIFLRSDELENKS